MSHADWCGAQAWVPASNPGRWRRVAASLAPAAMPGVMAVVFRAARGRFGRRRGYQAGFAVYWATCWAAAAAIAGFRPLAEAFAAGRRPLPAPLPVAVAALAGPPVAAVLTEFLPHVRRTGAGTIAASAVIGVTNALAEEAFWRALPVVVFPQEKIRGWLWPAAWFAGWHLVPLVATGTGGRRAVEVVAGAALIGVAFGWIASTTGSVAGVLVPHTVTDASGIRVVATFWRRSPTSRRSGGSATAITAPR